MLSGSVHVKAAHRTLMKLIPGLELSGPGLYRLSILAICHTSLSLSGLDLLNDGLLCHDTSGLSFLDVEAPQVLLLQRRGSSYTAMRRKKREII